LNPLVKLAASAVPGEKKFVLLAGAGISKDAGLPTSWDLMLGTAALLRAAESDPGKGDLQTWFLDSIYARMPYAELIGTLFPTAVEQQSFIRDKLKATAPGESHQLIAELARRGVIRCIITTNFDTLLEQALEGAGVAVQVIANDEDLRNSEPLIQCKSLRIYKPHGTIDVGHIRNSPADVQQLSSEMEAELSRVLREHGLIVLGYAGADESIRRVLRGGRNSHYPVFWVKRSEPTEEVKACSNPETFNFIPCSGASQFLRDLILVYERLESLVPSGGMSGIVADAIEAVRTGRRDAPARVRAFMTTMNGELGARSPTFVTGAEYDRLLEALHKSLPLVLEFARLAAIVAETGNGDSALRVYEGLAGIVQGYELPRGFSGRFFRTQFDYHKVLGHELCVMLFQTLLQEHRWEIISEIIGQGLYVENAGRNGPDVVGVEYISMSVHLLDLRGEKEGRLPNWDRAYVLAERHSTSELGRLSPMDDFIDTDFLLFLAASERRGAFGHSIGWTPWSILVAKRVPKFLLESYRLRQAEILRKVIRARDLETLRSLITSKLGELNAFVGRSGFHGFDGFEVERIGTE
jgi:hypothetical protein